MQPPCITWWRYPICSDPEPDKIRIRTIPNVIPSELLCATIMHEFLEALMTKMEAPFEQLLDQLGQPPTVIMADTYLTWAVRVGNTRNISVASFWPMSATVFSRCHHLGLLWENEPFLIDLPERRYDRLDYILRVSSTRLVDCPSFLSGSSQYLLCRLTEIFSWLSGAQCLLVPSIYEHEPQAIDAIKPGFSFPIYDIGPVIPFFKLEDHSSSTSTTHNDVDYFRWLDCQPNRSVLYISMGSFLSISSAQMDEVAAGLRISGIRYFWVARGEAYRLKEVCGDKGLLVPWCDQLSVLCRPSMGGFWTHSWWNSIQEGVFAGVPFLTFPIAADQRLNSKLILEDWKIGWRSEKEFRMENLLKREDIRGLVQKFIDLEFGKQ